LLWVTASGLAHPATMKSLSIADSNKHRLEPLPDMLESLSYE
jgi:hypothetical protein